MSLKSSLVAAALLTGFCAVSAQAQYVGPTEGASSQSVKNILEDPKDDQKVTLQGYLLRKLGNEKYAFSDGTSEIVAEIDDDEFPRSPIDQKTKVEIRGEVDTGLRRPPEIEVDHLRIIAE